MAHVIPATISEETLSEAEKETYTKLKNSLADRFTVFHSMDVLSRNMHGKLIDGEDRRRNGLEDHPFVRLERFQLHRRAGKGRHRIRAGRPRRGERCHDLLRQIAMAREITVIRGALAPDHLHMVISTPPVLAPAKIVQYLKGRSSRKLQMEYETLRKRYWGQHMWARGYSCATAGTVTDEIIKQYIENQTWDDDGGKGFDASWSAEFTSKTGRQADAWTVELAIPWKTIGCDAPKPGTKMGFNVARSRLPGSAEAEEVTQWSATFAGHHVPSQFGTLF